MDKVTIELTEEEVELLKWVSKNQYWLKPLRSEISRQNMVSGYLTLHFTNLGEVAGVDLLWTLAEKFSSLKVRLPIG